MVESVLVVVGFLSVTSAVLVAHRTPATGYELSPYATAPRAFWALLGCSLLVSLLVSLQTSVGWLRRIALGLGGIALAAFVGLPVIRGYQYYGAGDALTHLGWMRGIEAGAFHPSELYYPAVHTIATLVGVTFGIDLAQAALIVVVALSVLFFVFVAATTSRLFESPYSSIVGTFSAFLLLPITNLSTFVVIHPMTQGILFSAVITYLLFTYLEDPSPAAVRSATGAVLALTLVSTVVYHPQLAAHLLVFLVSICVVQYLARRFRPEHPIASHRRMYGQTLVLVAAFALWASKHGLVVDVIEFTFSNVVDYFAGDGDASEAVGSQSASLAELGASVVELFVKLFGASMVYLGLTGLIALPTMTPFGDRLTDETSGTIPYFVVGLAGLGVLAGVYYVGNVSQMYFRVFGLMMLFGTIAGAVAISYGLSLPSRRHAAGIVHGIAIAGIVVLLLASLLAVFPSPYIYKSSPHVTEMSMHGHESAFEHADEDVTFVGIRAGPNRYMDASNGRLQHTRGHKGAVTGEEIDEGIASQYSADRYLTVTQNDRDREVVAYQELRYSRDQLNSISGQPGVDKVQSNGEFELYYVHGRAE
ncbi:hypothetical protein [Halosolutus amylolyticus]|uniref:hypothetical protein n=1 Tax=Halosolutus amylolyticus TaxID=2932267 RepID=UPI0036D242AB